MSLVNIIWSTSNGGAQIAGDMNHQNSGNDLDNGMSSDGEQIFIRHDGAATITDVKFYLQAYSGSYLGAATPAADLAELLSWGDASPSYPNKFGGSLINWNATGLYPVSDWPTVSAKSSSHGFVHLTGMGDGVANAVTLPATITGASVAGQIPNGASPNIRFKMMIKVPSDDSVIGTPSRKVGIRQFDQVVSYTYTS